MQEGTTTSEAVARLMPAPDVVAADVAELAGVSQRGLAELDAHGRAIDRIGAEALAGRWRSARAAAVEAALRLARLRRMAGLDPGLSCHRHVGLAERRHVMAAEWFVEVHLPALMKSAKSDVDNLQITPPAREAIRLVREILKPLDGVRR